MAIIGWLVVTGILVVLSLAWLGMATLFMGQYNIGGKPNTWLDRLAVLAVGGLLAAGWWHIAIPYAPFTVAWK